MNQGISEARPWPMRVVSNAKARQRALIALMVLISFSFIVAFAICGFDYYMLDQAHRPLSDAHAKLKPSGTVGLKFGLLGCFLFALVYLYPLRKRWTWLSHLEKIGVQLGPKDLTKEAHDEALPASVLPAQLHTQPAFPTGLLLRRRMTSFGA